MGTALSIAGSDPTGGAGLQRDLQVFRHFEVQGAAVVTALTVQDTARVHQVLPVFPSVVLDQLRTLLADLTPDAIKIGMLGSDDVLRNVLLALEGLGEAPPPIVLDPVLLASDGTQLLERRAWGSLRGLVTMSTLVTPNLPEAETLTGRDASSRAGVEACARSFVEDLGAHAAIVKGGHALGPPDDCLAIREDGAGVRVEWLAGARIEGDPVHGTGCVLSAAIAAALARGQSLPEAVATGRRFVRGAIATAEPVGHGARHAGFGAARR